MVSEKGKTIQYETATTQIFFHRRGKKLQAYILNFTPNDAIHIKFSDGYQDQFVFAGADRDEIIGSHFEKSSAYAAAIQKDMQVFTYPVEAISIWRMPHKEFGNVWILKNSWQDEMHYGIFYDGQFQTNLQKINAYGKPSFVTGDATIAVNDEILARAKVFIEEKEEAHQAALAAAQSPLQFV
ncbi:MAG: hypothetical protein ABJB86_02845 [Bacteroidota bacterium]